ncbi:MAG: hypothetical protein K2W79_12960 [Hydrotalea flava]|nr:hypothetical protein [Hydrotalea flava]
MSQYYILKPAVGTNETGMAYPAVESFEDYDFNAPNSVHKLKSKEFPNFIPDLRFKLAKGSKLCDIMGQATINAHGFLISQKLKSIFENVNSVPCKFYSATIEDKQTIHQYYWVHFVWVESIKHIDYEKSSFYIKRGLRNIGNIRVVSYENFLIENNKMDAVNYLAFEHLNINTPIKYDCFVLEHSTEIYISFDLFEKIKTGSITGIEIEPATNVLLNLQS